MACWAWVYAWVLQSLALAGVSDPRQDQKASSPPNFIIINIDDLGYADIGPFGSKNKTPHLDRMAREGLRLKSHYAAPVCSPSRAALMTGCYPKRVLPIPTVLYPAAAVGLNPQEVTVAEILKQAGYATACIGKWHLGDQPEFLPTRQGFDQFFGLPYSNDMGPSEDGAKSNAGDPLPKQASAHAQDQIKAPSKKKIRARPSQDETGIRAGTEQPPLVLLRGEKVVKRLRAEEQFELTQQYTDEALKFIEEHQQQPFFLYLPYTAVHFPLYPSKSYLGSSGQGLLADWVREVDDSVGQVLQCLRKLHLDQKTLVLFVADNGGARKHGASNGPLRGYKSETWEGGIRVCAMVWWPGQIPSEQSTDHISTMMDVLPTFAYLAGVELPPDRSIDGVNLWPLWSGDFVESDVPRDHFFYYRGLRMEAVRSGPWKLHLDRKKLYHLEQDIGERNDLYSSRPEVVKRLQELALSMEDDLGLDGIGPGCREIGRVPQSTAQPLMNFDGKVRSGMEDGVTRVQ